MFKIKLKNEGINTEKRSVANLSKRVFICKEVRVTEEYDLKLNKRSIQEIDPTSLAERSTRPSGDPPSLGTAGKREDQKN